ncbi:MAG: hypothetical protein ACPGVG_16010 [Mycobacterium sp.]
MTREQEQLLLYCEDRAVNAAGRLDPACLNRDDDEILNDWNRCGFIASGRIASASGFGKWVELSRPAWDMAARLRRERGGRALASRTWKKTSEVGA